MYLDEFAVRVIASLLIERRLRRPGANHRVGALTENRTNATGRHDDRVGRKCPDFHRAQIHSANPAADTLRVEHRRKKFPRLVLLDLALGLITPHLLIECVKKLLAGGGSGKSSAMV